MFDICDQGLTVLSCCSFEVDIKHLSVSLGLFSSMTDLLIMSAKEIARLLHISTRVRGLRVSGHRARVGQGRGGGGCFFWRSCQGLLRDSVREVREGGCGGRAAVGSG